APVRTHRAAARGTRGLVVPSGGGVDGGPGWRGHGPALGGSAAVAGQLDLQLRRAEACGRPPGVQSVGARRGQLLLETAGFLFWGFTGELVCFLAGLVYPMWASFRVLEDFHEDPAGGAPEEWLAYWVSHTALTLLECVLRRFLELIPFYYPLRRRLLGLDGARAQEGGGGAPHQDCWPGRGPGRAAPLLRADAGRHAPAQAVLCTAGQPGGTLRPRPRGVRLLAASRHSACLRGGVCSPCLGGCCLRSCTSIRPRQGPNSRNPSRSPRPEFGVTDGGTEGRENAAFSSTSRNSRGRGRMDAASLR
ncbi:unnamed protein product, partial [Prorocentrum cordatum]